MLRMEGSFPGCLPEKQGRRPPCPTSLADGPDVPSAGTQLARHQAQLSAGTGRGFAQIFRWVLRELLQGAELLQGFQVI